MNKVNIILFDGHCNLCNASVDFLLRRDGRHGRLLFCAQQDPAAAAALARCGHSLPDGSGSGSSAEKVGDDTAPAGAAGVRATQEDDTVLVLAADGTLHERSGAVLRACAALGGAWAVLAALGRLLPAPAFDAAYGFVGRHRYRWFGQTSTCRLPSPAERRRFL